MIELRLQRIGDSVGVVLPREALDAIGIHGVDGEILVLVRQPDGRVELRRDGAEIADMRARIAATKLALLRDTMQKYEQTLRELAK